ncbi:16S rRNA (cytosine(967)-C(5))-methyltransferase RsmB [Marinicella gelatinilytica]|uniref:16S rRNA (cytosine(967)-C(5))-methyltransferase RsmB n=1 Tax=Marinicella gelatinilytica TaxID=2996017 RepID=UPI0022608C77|nr:16S rRNA (cytosine(967)-C(5))-methyltransferase RsmB [Marinicella gelatinilytica]MCX7544541.1 16S rRNA (cytosine(967)-C(5))-methyltransferase RsmB [Marinicella gelatinilytica]
MNKNRYYGSHILYRVLIKHEHLKTAMKTTLPNHLEAQDKAWIQHVCYMSLRHYYSLTARWQKFLHKPLKDQLVSQLLTFSMAQKIYAQVPDHAIVNEAVNAAGQLKKTWAKGLINTVLKQSLADDDFQADNEEQQYEHPSWWLAMLKKDWPDDWENIAHANNQPPPLWIRTKPGIDGPGQAHPHLNNAYLLTDKQLPLELLKAGHATVQDAAAQWAAHILKPNNGERILDACAAPGGKATHLLELNPHIQLDIVEQDKNRLQLIKDNLKRLQLKANRLIHGDAAEPNTWYQGQKYDKILLDVPCSASGVVRRHPDIKLLRQAQDMHFLTQLQTSILQASADLLVSGGLLLYATCSVFQAENERQIKRFLKANPNFEAQIMDVPESLPQKYGLQFLPGRADMDGFYYCLLKKS